MKVKRAVSICSLLVVSALPLSVFAQQQQLQPSAAASEANVAAQPNAVTQSHIGTVFGLVKKSSGNYVLIESGSKAHYTLDDQKKMRRYNGRVVAITGTVDPQSKTVHVQTVEVAA